MSGFGGTGTGGTFGATGGTFGGTTAGGGTTTAGGGTATQTQTATQAQTQTPTSTQQQQQQQPGSGGGSTPMPKGGKGGGGGQQPQPTRRPRNPIYVRHIVGSPRVGTPGVGTHGAFGTPGYPVIPVSTRPYVPGAGTPQGTPQGTQNPGTPNAQGLVNSQSNSMLVIALAIGAVLIGSTLK